MTNTPNIREMYLEMRKLFSEAGMSEKSIEKFMDMFEAFYLRGWLDCADRVKKEFNLNI